VTGACSSQPESGEESDDLRGHEGYAHDGD
jgi:hypothetical protein